MGAKNGIQIGDFVSYRGADGNTFENNRVIDMKADAEKCGWWLSLQAPISEKLTRDAVLSTSDRVQRQKGPTSDSHSSTCVPLDKRLSEMRMRKEMT